MGIFTLKKKLSSLVMVGMVFTMIFTIAPTNAFAVNGVTTARLFGTDRIGTAVAVSKAGWTTADMAILAPSANANLVDALAAAPLAGKVSPILLTEKDALNTNTKAELLRLGVTKVFVVGAINQTVVDQLNAMGNITATALKGANRTATAAAIAAKLVNPVGSFVVGYGALADALSVASYAAANNYSILVANADGSLPASEAPYKGTNVKIIGGPTLVANIAGATRYYGADRFTTNKTVLEALDYNYDKVYVANGTSSHLVDSLIASSLAAKSGALIVLGNGSSSAAAPYVYGKLATGAVVTALGGSTVVSKEMLEEVAYNASVVVVDPQESTRLNPASLNTTKTISVNDYFDNYTAQITLKQIIRGNDAWTMIEEANMFNSPPKDGYEYILAKINFKLIDIENGESLDIYAALDFSLISSDGREYDYVGEVTPEPELDASLYKGAVSEGWGVYQVSVDDATPTLTYGRNYDGTGGVWFKAYNDFRLVESVSLNKTTDSLIVGGTDNLIATVAPAEATNKNVIWSSSDNNIATVDNTGKVIAVSEGSATIKVVTEDGNMTASCVVVVDQSNVIKENTAISQDTTITGDLIIAPNARLTVNSGIKLIVNGNIYIYGELYNSGELNVSDTLYTNNYNNFMSGDGTLSTGIFINSGTSKITNLSTYFTSGYSEN